MEQTNEDVAIGKIIDEDSFSREKKHISIDNAINIDFIKKWKIIHDIKKSPAQELASIWQLKYYMYYLEQKDIHIEKAILDYPKIKKRVEVYLEVDDREDIEKILEEIKYINAMNDPYPLEKKSICKKCAYFELCYI